MSGPGPGRGTRIRTNMVVCHTTDSSSNSSSSSSSSSSSRRTSIPGHAKGHYDTIPFGPPPPARSDLVHMTSLTALRVTLAARGCFRYLGLIVGSGSASGSATDHPLKPRPGTSPSSLSQRLQSSADTISLAARWGLCVCVC
jgi:hypothetical protein